MKQIPQINFEANHWSELIDVSDTSNLREPPATKDLSNESIQDFVDKSEKPPPPTNSSNSLTVCRTSSEAL